MVWDRGHVQRAPTNATNFIVNERQRRQGHNPSPYFARRSSPAMHGESCYFCEELFFVFKNAKTIKTIPILKGRRAAMEGEFLYLFSMKSG
jgi:hypothetical protein